ncbi:hypothetical cytosolic protein [Syntrophus aciditrophicus SB]|jgi:hypothetical protein|uniref:Hypothetical cytosolic protein n=1 Tax=Syntrophus aciditrophicus (strain SB) TaxID=56780 RepID=Q2LWE1_SYNAS|nr:hypothetical cytosolic protein [Syntrophus aciditrophicus SB]
MLGKPCESFVNALSSSSSGNGRSRILTVYEAPGWRKRDNYKVAVHITFCFDLAIGKVILFPLSTKKAGVIPSHRIAGSRPSLKNGKIRSCLCNSKGSGRKPLEGSRTP